MATERHDIEVNVSTKGVAATQSQLRSVRKEAKDMGAGIKKDSALGIAGLRGLEVVATDAGRAIGVTGESASVFGRVVGSMSGALGKASLAFGVIGIAAYGAYLIYDKLAGSAKRVREETLKAAQAADTWIVQAAGEERATKTLRKEKEKLYQIEFDRKKILAERGIEAQTEKVIENYKKFSKAQRIWTRLGGATDIMTRMWYGTREDRKRALEDAKYDYEKGVVDLQEMYKKTGLFTEDVRTKGPKDKTSKARIKAEYNAELEYLQAVHGLWSQQDKNYQGHLDMQLAIFDAQSSAKLNKMSLEGATIAQIKDAAAAEDIRRMLLIASEEDRLRAEKLAKDKAAVAEKKRLENIYWQYGIEIAQGMTALAVQHGKKGAEEQKKAARMQAIVSTAAGVARALKAFDYPYNLYVGALVAAAGAVQISKINSATYGGAGGGGLAFGGGSVTGQPGTQGQGSVNLTLVVNGQTRNIGELTEGVLRELYNNNGSVGGISVAVERSI